MRAERRAAGSPWRTCLSSVRPLLAVRLHPPSDVLFSWMSSWGGLSRAVALLPVLHALLLGLLGAGGLQQHHGGDPSDWVGALRVPHYTMYDMPGVAYRVMKHLAQMKTSRRFRLYDYGSALANHAAYGSPQPPDIGGGRVHRHPRGRGERAPRTASSPRRWCGKHYEAPQGPGLRGHTCSSLSTPTWTSRWRTSRSCCPTSWRACAWALGASTAA